MRFLGIGKDGSLGDMYWALLRSGHEVHTYIEDPQWRGILRGFIHVVDDWKQELDWVRQDGGIIIFERANQDMPLDRSPQSEQPGAPRRS